MGSGGSTEAGNQPHDGGSKQQRADPRGNQGREGQRTARSDSPVNNNTPRNAKTKFIIKKDTNSDITNDLDMDSSWKKDSMQNNNQEMKNNEYNKKQNIQHSVLPPRLPTPPEDLPETYAQKKFREQYRQTELLRQKTIYRDPEEWELPEKVSAPRTTPLPLPLPKRYRGWNGIRPWGFTFFFQEYYILSSLKVIQVIRQVSQSNLKSNGFHLLTQTGITICKYLKKNIQVCMYFLNTLKKSLI